MDIRRALAAARSPEKKSVCGGEGKQNQKSANMHMHWDPNEVRLGGTYPGTLQGPKTRSPLAGLHGLSRCYVHCPGDRKKALKDRLQWGRPPSSSARNFHLRAVQLVDVFDDLFSPVHVGGAVLVRNNDVGYYGSPLLHHLQISAESVKQKHAMPGIDLRLMGAPSPAGIVPTSPAPGPDPTEPLSILPLSQANACGV